MFKNFIFFILGFILCLIAVSKTGLEIRIPPLDITKLITVYATPMSSIATVAIAFLTFIVVGETRIMRFYQYAQMQATHKETIRPLVEVFIEQSGNYFEVFDIRVENVGKGIAHDISLNLEEPKDSLSDSEIYLLEKLESIGFFKKNIKNLGIGRSRKSFLFTSSELSQKFEKNAFENCLKFKISFYDSEGTLYTNHSTIDTSEFEGISQVGITNIAYESYRELEKISKAISNITNSNKLNVEVFSTTEKTKLKKKKVNNQIYRKLNIPTNRILRYIKLKVGI